MFGLMRIDDVECRLCFHLWIKLLSRFFRRRLCEKIPRSLVWAKCMTQCGYQNHILISRIDNQRADLPMFESDVLPGFATIDGFEDTGAVMFVFPRIAASPVPT